MDIQPLFDALDARDAKAAGKLFTEDATFTFGNGEPAVGRGAIEDALSSFFSGLKGVRHRLIRTWEHPDCVVLHGEVTFTRSDDRSVTLPFADFIDIDGGKISKWLVYADVTPLSSPG